MSKPELLILDDEKEVLNALNRVLRKDFELHLYSDPHEAIAFFENSPVPLVISDMRMPIMDGATFLSRITELNPKSKRFLLTGHADINLTVTAVNEGKISHYFAKPWDNFELISELKLAYELYTTEVKSKRLLKQNIEKNTELSLLNSSLELEINKSNEKLEQLSFKEAKSFVRLKKTLSTFINLKAEIISLHTMDTSKHNFRVASHARSIAEKMACDNLTVFQIYIAGLLYETGKLSIAQSLLSTPIEHLNQQERTSYNSFYGKGATLLEKVKELANVANIIKHIPEHYNGLGVPERLSQEDIPLGSRIISVVATFDNLVLGRQTQLPTSLVEAKHRIEELANKVFDPQVINLYFDLLDTRPAAKEGTIEYPANIAQLKEGDVLTQDLNNGNMLPLLTKGVIVESHHIEKLTELEIEHNSVFTLFIAPRN